MLPETNIAVNLFRSCGCWRLRGNGEHIANGANPDRRLDGEGPTGLLSLT